MRWLVDAQLASALARWLADPIVWIRYGNVRRVELMARLAEAWPGVIQALERGEVLIELA